MRQWFFDETSKYNKGKRWYSTSTFLRCYLDDKFPKIVTTATPMLLKFHLRETMYGISTFKKLKML